MGLAKFRTDLAVSVSSAVVVAVGGAVVADVAVLHWLTQRVVPLWVVLALAVALLIAVVARRPRNRQEEPQRVFVYMPAFDQKHWLAALLQETIRTLDRHRYRAELILPAEDYSGLEQSRHLAALLERADDYAGGLIVPAKPEGLPAFCQEFGKPVVFADIRPFQHPSQYPPNSAFVGYRAEDLGRQAAAFVGDHLAQAGRDRPRVLVIGSTSHPGRQEAFVESLRSRFPTADIQVSSAGAFDRSRARDIAAAHLARAARTGSPIDAVFGTNDEMAQGAVDAIAAAGADPIVVGVDGTREAVALIRSGASPLRATVRQDPRAEAEAAVAALVAMLTGERPAPETFLDPELIPADPTPRQQPASTG